MIDLCVPVFVVFVHGVKVGVSMPGMVSAGQIFRVSAQCFGAGTAQYPKQKEWAGRRLTREVASTCCPDKARCYSAEHAQCCSTVVWPPARVWSGLSHSGWITEMHVWVVSTVYLTVGYAIWPAGKAQATLPTSDTLCTTTADI